MNIQETSNFVGLSMSHKPPWLKSSLSHGPEVARVRSALRYYNLNTVCEEARCPNIGKCFSSAEATFLILGKNCTRDCSFCNIARDTPDAPDPSEPERIALAVRQLGLRYIVVTSPTRDDLSDGGAFHFRRVVSELKRTFGGELKVEVLVPDFIGRLDSVEEVMYSSPDVFAHNIETVPRLYSEVRRGASYHRSLSVLEMAKARGESFTKSGLMLGLGESVDEAIATLKDLRTCGCDIITIGQYLSPSKAHSSIKSYVPPEVFTELGNAASEMGFLVVSSGPLVRSSLDASLLYEKVVSKPSGNQPMS